MVGPCPNTYVPAASFLSFRRTHVICQLCEMLKAPKYAGEHGKRDQKFNDFWDQINIAKTAAKSTLSSHTRWFPPSYNLVYKPYQVPYIYIYAPGPATPPPLPPHGMGPIYWPHMRSPLPPPVVWWRCGTVPLPPVVWWGCGMVCWVCMVCMVGLVWHVWKVWYVWYVW